MYSLYVYRIVPFVTLALLGWACPAHTERRVPEPKDTFFAKDATVHAAVSGEAYIGFASADDFGGKKRPTSPTVRFETGSSVEKALSVFNKSHVTLSGGKIAAKAAAYDNSVLTLSSGDVGGGVYADAGSMVNLSGGRVGDGLYVAGNSMVNMSGGSVQNGLFVSGHGTVNYSGGNISLLLTVSDSGTLHLIGKGLSKTPSKSSPAGDTSFTTYTLVGKLRDGSSVAGKTVMVQNKTGAKLLLTSVP